MPDVIAQHALNDPAFCGGGPLQRTAGRRQQPSKIAQ
jgi:hypothetical protein